MKGTKNNPFQCGDVSEAFDTAREKDAPVWCFVKGVLGKYFPSGKWVKEE